MVALKGNVFSAWICLCQLMMFVPLNLLLFSSRARIIPEEEAFECNNSKIAMETQSIVSSVMCLCDTPGRGAWGLLVVASCVAVPWDLIFLSFEWKVIVGMWQNRGAWDCCRRVLHNSGIPDCKIPSLRMGVLSQMWCCCHFGGTSGV